MATILVVDDEPEVLRTIGRMVGRIGHEVVPACGGRLALEHAKARRPDAALVDIMMPQMDGIETIRALRALYSGMPLIAMSGGGTLGLMQYLEMATKLGADATIAKPIDDVRLQAVLAEVLGSR